MPQFEQLQLDSIHGLLIHRYLFRQTSGIFGLERGEFYLQFGNSLRQLISFPRQESRRLTGPFLARSRVLFQIERQQFVSDCLGHYRVFVVETEGESDGHLSRASPARVINLGTDEFNVDIVSQGRCRRPESIVFASLGIEIEFLYELYEFLTGEHTLRKNLNSLVCVAGCRRVRRAFGNNRFLYQGRSLQKAREPG